ncbi:MULTISPECIES: carbohydrate ABC transporter permease [Brachybacterium]|uniref:Sugar ABC transporter permease n=4 Tax=Brachybacterium TaxID=43668 RepID=A0A3R8RTA8_9MICO|nr:MULTISPECIES: sugar ABC transporter permease [Brachybacterium]MCT1437563.1 sugar ABC transporter permease [Brachybacterium paraconglomeratum]MCZ4325849.1 sugar ABC transporter permease [Brachybacterium paraconglomeratum]RRR20406.1 sugar ABC transporter permease [Brachybacterium paraconglomeratum]TDP79089.1 multiple sugar transport system permease protein [Brachybacterium sp. AG952]GAP79762.1 n-Acetyl-D-glucosamine ABC transport system, permease protein 1 [Brachybacterium sp. SW0106-09]
MSTATTSTRSAPTRRRRKDDTKLALLFIAPASVGLLVFLVWPLLTGLYYSFTEYTTLTPPTWVGLENYRRLLADPVFWNSLKVTVLYVLINIGVQTVVALVIAVLMQRLTQSTVLRSLVLAPYLVSNVVAAIVFLWILDTQLGIFNILLQWIGFDPIAFWASETWVIPTVALVNVWRHMGYTALLLFAGLQSIPAHLYEAARTEGAGEIAMFRRITLPLLRPILALVLIMTIIGSFQVFDTISVTTQGGPADASKVLQMYIYENAFAQYEFGYASALSVALLVILMVITFAQYWMSRAGQSDLD